MRPEDDRRYEAVGERGRLAELHFGASVAAFSAGRACEAAHVLIATIRGHVRPDRPSKTGALSRRGERHWAISRRFNLEILPSISTPVSAFALNLQARINARKWVA
jgi:hypothetical protein